MRRNWLLISLNFLLLLALFMFTQGALLDMKYLVEPASMVDNEMIEAGYRHITVYCALAATAIIMNVGFTLWNSRTRKIAD